MMDQAVLKGLEQLQKGIDQIYKKMYEKIPEEYWKEALLIFRILIISMDTLSLERVVEILALDLDSCKFDPMDKLQDPHDLFDICPNFLSLEHVGRKNMVSFAHYSVKE